MLNTSGATSQTGDRRRPLSSGTATAGAEPRRPREAAALPGATPVAAVGASVVGASLARLASSLRSAIGIVGWTLLWGATVAPSAGAQGSEPLEVVLTVQEPERVAREGDLAWASVPLPPGRLSGTDRLMLEDGLGRELPLQVEVLARWWHLDGSIAWLGLEFPVTLPKGGETTVVLRERTESDLERPLEIEGKLELRASEGELVVDTGVIEATIRRGSTLPFAEVRLDADRDGKYLDRERVLRSSDEAGVELIDAKERIFRAEAGLEEIVIEREGPLHAVVRISGVHRPLDGGEGVPELLSFSARLHFYRGESVVRVEWTLRNAPLESPWGAVPFRSYRMIVPGQLGQDSLDYYFEADEYVGLLPPGTAKVAQSRSAVALFQFGPKVSGAGARDESAETRSGYFIGKLTGRSSILHSGERASSVVLAAGRRFGFGAGLRDIWQNHPKMLGWGAGGRLEIGLWPDSGDPRRPHTLEDQTQKTHEIWFHFFQRRGDGGELFQREAKSFLPLERRVRGRPSVETIVESGVWGDLGDLAQVPTGIVHGPQRFAGRLFTVHLQRLLSPQGSGWQYYGAADPLGRPEGRDLEPRFPLLGAWIQTGNPFFFELSSLRARHSRDLRPIHLDGFRADGLPSEAEPVVGGQLGKRFGRDQLSPEVAALQEKLPSTQRPFYGNAPYGEDLEEVELLVQHWWLTGERASLEAATTIGQQILTWREVRGPTPATSEAAATSDRAEAGSKTEEAAGEAGSKTESGAGKGGSKTEGGAGGEGKPEETGSNGATGEASSAAGGSSQSVEPIEPRRAGWILRALGFLYQATGDEAYLEAASRLTARLRDMQDPQLGYFGEVRGPSHLGGVEEPSTENWSAGVLARGLLAIHRWTGDSEVRDMIEGLASFWVEEAWAPDASRGQGSFRIESLTEAPSPPHYRGLPREEWLLPGLVGAFRVTGQVRFREKLFAALPRLYGSWAGVEPAILVDWFQAPLVERARWERIRTRPDLDRPQQPIGGLEAEASAGGVVLSWIAPADPAGRSGTRYQIKLAPSPIVPFVRLAERETTEAVPFWSLPNRFATLPVPAAPGEEERVVLDLDLEPGVYFFSIRWEDQRGRWSPISENARIEISR